MLLALAIYCGITDIFVVSNVLCVLFLKMNIGNGFLPVGLLPRHLVSCKSIVSLTAVVFFECRRGHMWKKKESHCVKNVFMFGVNYMLCL